MLECVYWKVIILQIWYTKGCLLKEQNPFILDIPKGVYWLKKCLLNEKVPTSRKCAYWIKMCLLNKNMLIEWKCAYWPKKVPIEWKSAYWQKMCLLKNENAQRTVRYF